MASNGSCFMTSWTIFKNYLLEGGLTQNHWETMPLRMLTTADLFFFYQVWGSAWIEIHWISIWLRTWSHMTSHYTWGSVTTLNGFGGGLGRPLDTFFWALTISWSRFLAHVWSIPKGHSTHEIEGLWLMHFKIFLLVEKVETTQFHFALEGKGLRAQQKWSWMKYLHGFAHDIINNVFMVCWNLCQAHLQVPLNEDQGPSRLHGNGTWLISEAVALNSISTSIVLELITNKLWQYAHPKRIIV